MKNRFDGADRVILTKSVKNDSCQEIPQNIIPTKAQLTILVGIQSIQVYCLIQVYSVKIDAWNFDPSYKNMCINGKERSQMTFTQQLKEFRKGPCSPIVFTPGIFATKLRLEIDCKTLQVYFLAYN